MAGIVIRVLPIKAEVFDVEKVRKGLEAALVKSGKRMTERFNRTVQEWKAPAKMGYEVEMGDHGAIVWSGPTTEIENWARLDDGSPPHDIVPKNGPYLIFPFQGVGRSYASSTKPRIFGSMRWAKFGPITRFTHVSHPGHEPRGWSIDNANLEMDVLPGEVQDAIDKGME